MQVPFVTLPGIVRGSRTSRERAFEVSGPTSNDGSCCVEAASALAAASSGLIEPVGATGGGKLMSPVNTRSSFWATRDAVKYHCYVLDCGGGAICRFQIARPWSRLARGVARQLGPLLAVVNS